MRYKSVFRSGLFYGQIVIVTGGGKTVAFNGFHLATPPRVLRDDA